MVLTKSEIEALIKELKYLQEATGYNSFIKNKLQTIINKLNK